MPWDVSEEHGRRRGWQAICHEIISIAAGLERDLDYALALAHGRSDDAVQRLHTQVFPRVGVDVKIGLLESVLDSTTDPESGHSAEVFYPFLVPGLRSVFHLRNTMAHGEVSRESTDRTLVLESRRRGEHTRREEALSSIQYLRRPLSEALRRDLDALGRWAVQNSELRDETHEQMD